MEKIHGKKTGVVDLTRGELGSRGTPELRAEEAARAAAILQLDARENLGMADGFFRNDESHQRLLIQAIRLASVEEPAQQSHDTGSVTEPDSRLSVLTRRERQVIELRFGLNGEPPRTLEEVGREFGVTRERIRQIENTTLKKLETLPEAQALRDCMA